MGKLYLRLDCLCLDKGELSVFASEVPDLFCSILDLSYYWPSILGLFYSWRNLFWAYSIG